MSKTPITLPSCKTPYIEQNGQCYGWLGNPRWSGIPAVPKRDRSQQGISEPERTKAAELLKQYRAEKAVREANNLEVFNHRLVGVQYEKRWDEVQAVKKQIAEADHGKFVAADSKMRQLEAEAAGIIKRALPRLVESFDSELVEYSAQRESELLSFNLPLFEDTMKDGQPRRHWTLWDDRIATSLHACREVARERLQSMDHPGYTAVENNSRFAINTLIFLCTDEEINFSWLG